MDDFDIIRQIIGRRLGFQEPENRIIPNPFEQPVDDPVEPVEQPVENPVEPVEYNISSVSGNTSGPISPSIGPEDSNRLLPETADFHAANFDIRSNDKSFQNSLVSA